MIETKQSSISYTADGVQTQWEFPYSYFSVDDIKLFITEDGVRTQIPAEDYTFDVTTKKVTYPILGEPVSAGSTVELTRQTDITQLEDSTIQNFKSNDVERIADKLTLISQDLKQEMADIVAPEGGAIAETVAAAVQAGISTHNATSTAHISHLVAKTGSTMTGDLTMAKNGTTVSGVRFLDGNDTGYRIFSARDLSNNKQLRMFDTSAGNGMFLNGGDGNRPYYWNGIDTSSKLLLPSDITSKSNTDLDNLTETGEAHFANPSLSNLNNTGKSTGAGWAMPSNIYDDLTLGASGATYQAPANGYFCFFRTQPNSAGYSSLTNTTTGFVTETRNTAVNAGNGVWLLARKGDIVELSYDGGTTLSQWRFYYAEGSKSEAN